MTDKPLVQLIANVFLGEGKAEKVEITLTKLTGLVFIAYGFAAVQKNQKLFNTKIEAWRDGVVIPELFHEFKRLGNQNLAGQLATIHGYEGKEKMPAEVREEHVWVVLVINDVWNFFKDKTDEHLYHIMTCIHSPWAKLSHFTAPFPEITYDMMQGYFSWLKGNYSPEEGFYADSGIGNGTSFKLPPKPKKRFLF